MDEHPDEPVFQSLAAVAAEKLGQSLPDNYQRFRMARLEKKNVAVSIKHEAIIRYLFLKYGSRAIREELFLRIRLFLLGLRHPCFKIVMKLGWTCAWGTTSYACADSVLEDAWYKSMI